MTGPLISGSILSSDHGHFRDAVSTVSSAGADWIHFDVMDGQFVPPITFGADVVAACRKDCPLPFEAHLMTMTPELHFESFVIAGVQRVIFQVEATSHAYRLCQMLKAMNVESGVALNPGTPVEAVMPLLKVADLILVMTVNPGWGGQVFLGENLDKVKRIRAAAPEIHIEVDGGINDETIGACFQAGANVIVSGSYVARSQNAQEAIANLRRQCG